MSDELIELPEGWEWVTLDKIMKKIVDGTHHTPTYIDNGIPFLSVKDIRDGQISFDSCKYISQEEHGKLCQRCHPEHGDLLITKSGTIGRCAVVKTKRDFSLFVSVALLKPATSEVNVSFISLAFQAWFQTINVQNDVTGTAIKNFHLVDFRKLALPLAPLNEQKRIVAKIEELNDRTQRAKEALETIPQLCDRFRQAVLAAAFRGDLTADWREQNPDVEPASVLLERIRIERRQCWENHLLIQAKNPKKSKYQEPVEIENKNLALLPDKWCWTTLGNIAWLVKDGPHFSPKYSESGIPFISGGNVKPDGVDFQNVKYISPELHKELSQRCVPEIGDILYTKGGTTGIARVNTYAHPFNVWVHVAVLKCVPSLERFYLQYALNAPNCYEQSQNFTHGVGNQDLGLTRMVKITIPLAPLEEQKIIVTRINQYIDAIKKLEKLIDNTKEQAEYINQSILAKAFRGELVAQDADDEPASVLLERIRAEREKLNNGKQKSQRTSKRKSKTVQGQGVLPGFE